MDCIVIDDCLVDRKTITSLIDQVDFLNLKKECSSAVEAFNYLKTENVDLIFLDIEMPGMTGIELIKNLKKCPIIIFVTSNKDYAIEAFELNVADYILKPLTLSRFMAAIDKAKEISYKSDKKNEFNENSQDYIFVRSNSALIKIKLNDILYVQAFGDYIKIFTPTKYDIVHCTLKSIEEKLAPNKFFRLHRSYIVAINHIDKIEEKEAFLGQDSIPIGEQYKKGLLTKLNLL